MSFGGGGGGGGAVSSQNFIISEKLSLKTSNRRNCIVGPLLHT